MTTLIEHEVNEDATGKNWDSLAKSRKIRSDFIRTFGCVPTSILIRDTKDEAIDLISKGSYAQSSLLVRKGETNRAKLAAFGSSSMGCAGGGLSKFPQNIGRLLVRFYCPENGTVYDPFAGHNSRMQLTYECGRNYVGVDVSHDFMRQNKKVRHQLLAANDMAIVKTSATIELIEGSSANVKLPSDFADFTVTSPPYWDIEYYGDEPEQLGNAKTYESFLDLLSLHIKENFRILKPGAFCCWCINDFKKGGKYYAYHADLIPIFERIGFNLHTIYIIDLVGSLQASFVQSIMLAKAFPKRHEYCLVFRRPELEEPCQLKRQKKPVGASH